jgi:hypothetical protein
MWAPPSAPPAGGTSQCWSVTAEFGGVSRGISHEQNDTRSTEADFSLSYDINSHRTVCLGEPNLNDRTFSTHGSLGDRVLDVVDFGRRPTLGVGAKW